MPIPKALSEGEELFALHCKAYGLIPIREYEFSEDRKWRFDFYFPGYRIAVEIDGGIYTNGRHNRAGGFEKDLEKMNYATLHHWRVFRFTPRMVSNGTAIDTVRKAMLQ